MRKSKAWDGIKNKIENKILRGRKKNPGKGHGCLLRGRGLIVQPHRVRVPCRLIPRSVGRDAHPVGLDVEDDTTLAPRSVASRHP